MGSRSGTSDIVKQLQDEVLAMQGWRSSASTEKRTLLAPFEAAFQNHAFPTGAVHEFISKRPEDAAATNGFISGLLHHLIPSSGTCLWIGTERTIFPPALTLFGIAPEHIIFIDLAKERDVLWVVEEALKSNAAAAVIGELRELSFKDSRRLQLAVERSGVTGFIHRCNPKTENTVACVTRWEIAHLPSQLDGGMPGVGFPRWNVQLTKVRNGRPGTWQIEWCGEGFRQIPRQTFSIPEVQILQTG